MSGPPSVYSDKRARVEEYHAYLRSEAWKTLRDHAVRRVGGICQFCGKVATQAHHVRYPKRFDQDSISNVVATCDPCHKTAHGINEMDEIEGGHVVVIEGPAEVKFRCVVGDGYAYATADAWIATLRIPASRQADFPARVRLWANNATYCANFSGPLQMWHDRQAVFRWEAAAKVLDELHVAFKGGQFRDDQAMAAWHERFERFQAWGWSLQSRAMAQGTSAIAERTGTGTDLKSYIEATLMLNQTLAGKLVEQRGQITVIDQRVTRIETAVPVLADPAGFVHVARRLAERCINVDDMPHHPRSRSTVAQMVGTALRKSGATRGKSAWIRLPNSSIDTEVNTYRRSDIDAVIDRIYANN